MARSLEAYRARRDFKATPEPPARKRKSGGQSFVVQKHAARQLHYDFRLELDGVLLSWAVAKGPSLVPGEKRLAVHVEDHPLDYGGFEGTIPAGQYGAGSVMVWDRGEWEPEGDPRKGMAKGHLDFTLRGEKLSGRWHLVRMRARRGEKAENWLLIKSDDDAARTAQEPDILDAAPRSVLTRRTIEAIGSDQASPAWTTGKAAASAASAHVRSPRRKLLDAFRDGAREASAPPVKARAVARTALAQPTKRSTRRSTAQQPQLAFINPQLASLANRPPESDAYIHEVKFDGYRMQAGCEHGAVHLWTRRGLDWTDRFAVIAEALAAIDGRLQLDGEIVVEDRNGIADFAALQAALRDGDQTRLVFYAFDLLVQDGEDLTRKPLMERKRRLKQVIDAVPAGGPLRYSDHFEDNGALMLQHVCRLGAEGIVSKKRDSLYRGGRTTDWLKAKCANRQEFVVIGFAPSTSTRKAVGSLVLGYYDAGKLIHAGRVGTGFSSRIATELHEELSHDRTTHPATTEPVPAEARRNVVWVAPRRVAEVEFRGWTGAGLLRQAAFKGLRDDKDPREIIREPTEGAVHRKDRSSSVKLTHPDRLLWPEAGITKEGLADYYSDTWRWMDPHVTGRPLALVRCPTGIDQPCFFQKHGWKGMAAHVRLIADPQDKERILGIDSFDGLMALVQASVLEIHPWGARSDDLERPDRLTFDLDPGEGVAWSDICAGAREVRARLKDAGLESFAKTSGGKGLHVVVPLSPRSGWDDAKDFCHKIAQSMARDTPTLFTASMAKKERDGRIYVDYLRNGRGATAVAAYSPRARADAGVSTPLSWSELDSCGSGARFTLTNLHKRLDHLTRDPWQGFEKIRQAIEPAQRARARRR